MDILLWYKCVVVLYKSTSVTYFIWLGVGPPLGQKFWKMPSVFEIHVRALVLPSPSPLEIGVIAVWQNVNSNVCRGG